MVCLPCIFLPIVMAIYMKFIMPYIYRLLPESWVRFIDPYLYPTCPVKPPTSKKDENEEVQEEVASGCCVGAEGDENKKDQ